MQRLVLTESRISAVRQWLTSRWFWRLTLVLFSLQAFYVALVGRFSMAFDEYYHLGSIQAYAKVWLPWSVQQPAGPATIGAIQADPSYLYHYLMSFPYRILIHLTGSVTAQIIALRLIDVLIVIIGLYVFRRLLLKLGMPKYAAHGLLFFVTLLPMTPFLAGQLTYDTLWFTMTAITVLAMVTFIATIKNQHRLPLNQMLVTLTLLLVTSQIKYAFLPMALAGGAFMLIYIILEARSGRLSMRKTLAEWRTGVQTPLAIASIALVLVSGGLFVTRYGSNIVSYHNPVPSCDAVLGRDSCLAYGPFARDENHRTQNFMAQLTVEKKLSYPFGWFTQMMTESYFAVGPMEIDYPTVRPLPVSFAAGYVIVLFSLVVLIFRGKYLWQKGDNERLLLAIVSVYTLFLFVNNYHAYLTTGAPVAIHGRYMLALLPLIGYLAYVAMLTAPWWKRLRGYIITGVLALIVASVYGGGITPFIIRSSDNWYWQSAVPTSKIVRSALWPVVIR